MKKIVFATVVSLVMFVPICTAQEETSFATAEAYADDSGVGTYAEAYASTTKEGVDVDLNSTDEVVEVTGEAQSQEIYYQLESSQDQIYTQQTQPQTRSIANSNIEQLNKAEESTTNADEIAVKVDTISQLADDTIKQTDIIEKQNAKTLNLFLVALGAIALILILTIANFITQRRIKYKLLQNA